MPVEIGPFSKIPSKFFGSGIASSLGTSPSLLYIALCENANRNNGNTFRASDKALASETGLGTRTICDARKKLIEYGLIFCSREDGQSHKYTIENPQLKWVPLRDRLRKKMKPRAIPSRRTVSV